MAQVAGLPERDAREIVETAEDVFRSLSGARIFLTGATGFYGAWLLGALAYAKKALGLTIPVVVLTRDAERARSRYRELFEAAAAELVTGDTRDFRFPEGRFTHVIHGATSASASLNDADPLEMFDVIVSGTRRVLELASASGPGTRVLFMSSGAVYGPQPSDITHVPETFLGGPNPLDMRNAYAEGKRAAEQLSAIFAKKRSLEVVAARGFAFVGPYLPLDVHFAIGNFLRDALERRTIRILGDGTPYRSYLYGSDLAAWMWTLLVRGQAGAAYNVGSGDGRPLREIAERVACQAGVTFDVAKTAPPGHAPSRYVPDVSRAARELGLEVRVGLDDAIARTLAFHRSALRERA